MLRMMVALLAMLAGIFPSLVNAVEPSMLQEKEAPADALWLHKLDLMKMTVGAGAPQPDRSVSGKPITLQGAVYPHGVGVNAPSEFSLDLKGAALRFSAMVGVDDDTAGKGSAIFEVWVDDQLAFDSGLMRGGDTPKMVDLDLSDAKRLELVVQDGGDGLEMDHADWAGAMFFLKPGATEKPQSVYAFDDEEVMSIASSSPTPEPMIHGPRITGATPGRPFLFLIPATGESPLGYTAENLPKGLTIASDTGIISGALEAAGTTDVLLGVTGPKGAAYRTLTIVGGEGQLALTPPMGWNSWFVWAGHVDDAKMRAAAAAMAASGLAAHGYQYINLDDTWSAQRNDQGEIQTNDRFPDMKALGDYIHGKGLKFGIYSSPGPGTCAGYAGSYKHEAQDAAAFARWGVDFLKYDWCSYGAVEKSTAPEALQKPFRAMRAAMEQSGRDMVFSICQYGRGAVWEWGGDAGGNLWRTTDDSGDAWSVVSLIAASQNGLEAHAGPGRWNDPDMIQAGLLGMSSTPRPTRLTRNEQITQMTLWCLLAAPIMLSCDLTQLDAFTKDLLMNDEVLDVDQDALGRQGARRSQEGRAEVWSRPLVDGTLAVGLLNLGRKPAEVTARWADLGLAGPLPVRDLWRKKNLGEYDTQYTTRVPRHGAVLLKIGKPNR